MNIPNISQLFCADKKFIEGKNKIQCSKWVQKTIKKKVKKKKKKVN